MQKYKKIVNGNHFCYSFSVFVIKIIDVIQKRTNFVLRY